MRRREPRSKRPTGKPTKILGKTNYTKAYKNSEILLRENYIIDGSGIQDHLHALLGVHCQEGGVYAGDVPVLDLLAPLQPSTARRFLRRLRLVVVRVLRGRRGRGKCVRVTVDPSDLFLVHVICYHKSGSCLMCQAIRLIFVRRWSLGIPKDSINNKGLPRWIQKRWPFSFSGRGQNRVKFGTSRREIQKC